jgi:sialic acid synthase SpsE
MSECVAEFTTNHFGHMGLLDRMVDAAAAAGASAIKMQRKQVATYYSADKLKARFASPFGKTYREYRGLFEMSTGDWQRFNDQCRVACIPWFVTAQDVVSLRAMVPWCEKGCGLQRIKVASSNARNTSLSDCIQRIVPTSYEIVVSLAGATLADIGVVVKRFENYRRLYLLHCVAEYPCPPERLRLGNIPELQKRFGSERILIGYSGHEIGFQPTLAAAELGAEMIERHFCMSRHSFVHHIECSLEPAEFTAMVRAVNRHQAPEGLPEAAYRSEFGMSEAERKFLVDQAYGQDFLGERSILREGQS